MADIKIEDLNEGEDLKPEAMKGIYGGVGAADAPSGGPVGSDPNAPPTIPIVPIGPGDTLPGQGDVGNAGGGTGGSCQL